MDIQKERKAFEALYKPCDRIAFCFGLKKYVQLSNEDNDSEIVDHANQCWELWQAAKAQAIPEGFVLVPRNELTTTYYWDGAEYVVSCVSEYEIDLGKGEIAELEKWEQTKSTKAFFANIYSDEDNFEIVEFDSIEAAQLAVRENKAMVEAQERK